VGPRGREEGVLGRAGGGGKKGEEGGGGGLGGPAEWARDGGKVGSVVFFLSLFLFIFHLFQFDII
jgi:hypothetical protein